MSKKTRILYDLVFAALKELLPSNLNVVAVLTDFEAALSNSLGEVFPEASRSGYWFHFTQAIFRRVQREGLAIRYRDDRNFRTWVKSVMALSLLPTDVSGADMARPEATQRLLGTPGTAAQVLQPVLRVYLAACKAPSPFRARTGAAFQFLS